MAAVKLTQQPFKLYDAHSIIISYKFCTKNSGATVTLGSKVKFVQIQLCTYAEGSSVNSPMGHSNFVQARVFTFYTSVTFGLVMSNVCIALVCLWFKARATYLNIDDKISHSVVQMCDCFIYRQHFIGQRYQCLDQK